MSKPKRNRTTPLTFHISSWQVLPFLEYPPHLLPLRSSPNQPSLSHLHLLHLTCHHYLSHLLPPWPPLPNPLNYILGPSKPIIAPLKPQDNGSMCYRCLGPPAFFHHPTLFTVPFLVGHDNQGQRNLLRDLGPIYRWWCSEHHLLKAESTASLLSHFLFILDLFISSSAWLCLILLSHHYAYTLASAWLTYPPSLVIMLTLICHSHLLL